MKVLLMAHTQLSREFQTMLNDVMWSKGAFSPLFTDGQAVALTAIRTCYSPLEPSKILLEEGDKYFGQKATDGGSGSEADRLIRHIMSSGHTSTIEHLSFTFLIEGLSRVALAQLTRHRVGVSFSVQSQRYVKFGSKDKAQGFNLVVPPSWKEKLGEAEIEYVISQAQKTYDDLRSKGIPAEDARMALPIGATCNLVMTTNLRGVLEFHKKRGKSTHAQWEIQNLAEAIREKVIEVEPWTEPFFVN